MKLTITIFFVILNSFVAFSQQYEIIPFQKGEYLGRSNFNDFCQDSSLSIYFGTDRGLLKYDGDNFSTVIDRDSTLDQRKVQHLSFFKGDIFIASEETFYKYNLKSKQLETITSKEVNFIKVINDKVYFSTSNALYEYVDSNNITELFIDQSVEINTWVYHNKQFILGSKKGLIFLDKDNKPSIKGSYLNVKGIKKNSDESLLVLGSLQKNKWALFRYSSGDITKLVDLPKSGYTDLYITSLANVLISNEDGELYDYDGLKLQPLVYYDEIVKFSIGNLVEDREKNLWVLGNKGLFYIKINAPINQFAKAGILDFSAADNEQIYFTKNSIHIHNTYGQQTKISLKRDFNNNAIYPFRVNENWHFNKNGKLFKIVDSQVQEIKLNPTIKSVLKIENSLIGLGDSATFMLGADFRILKKITDFKYVDLIVGSKGIILLNQQKHVVITKNGASGEIPSPFDWSDPHTYLDDNNDLWLYNDTTVQNISKNKALQIPSSFRQENFKIFNIFNDNNSHIWLSTNDAILKIKIEELDSKYAFSDADSYNKSDYFLNTYFRKVIASNNDLLYFIHESGISTFNSLLNNANLVPPGLKIKKALAYSLDNYHQITDTVNLLTEQNTFLSTKNRVVIAVVPVNFNRIYKSIIYYRDNQSSEEWIKVGNNEFIYLNDLAAGRHQLEFKSVNSDGVESEYQLPLNIFVSAPYWTQYWFITIIGLLMILVAYIIYRSIINFKDSKTKELHEKLDKELADLEKRSHLQILKAERLKQLNELITSQKSELEKKNKQIESQKYELSLTNSQIKEQKDLLEETSSKLKASINYAQRIQDALMSTEIEIKEAIDDSFVYFQPRDVVSGDFYWFNNVVDSNGHQIMILAAVDCTGHGVPGAIVSVVGMNLLNNITKLKKIYDPGKILYELNKDIIYNLRQSETQVNDGMDMSIVAINNTTKEIKFAGAKNPLIYVENKELFRIRGDKNAIGGQQRGQERDYITHTIPPSIGQKRTFYLFSDGYQDQFGGVKGFKFLTSNFKELLLSIHEKPVLDQKEILYNTINDWKGDYNQTDDMLVIGFKF